MKKLIRSTTWKDQIEKQPTSENLGKTQPARLAACKPAEKQILDKVAKFYQNTGEAPAFSIIVDELTRENNNDALALMEEVTNEPFLTGASYLAEYEEEVEKQAADLLVEVLKRAAKIAKQGEPGKGAVVKGTNAAVSFLFSTAKPKPPTKDDKMPTSMREAGQKLSELYKERKANPYKSYGIMTGYALIDHATAGIGKTQLYLHVGYGGHLKTTHALNMVVNAALLGWNIMFFSSEMPAAEIQFLIYAIHSGNKKFAQVGQPLNAKKLRLGQLTDPQEEFYEIVKNDLLTTPGNGSIRVVSSSEFTTFASVKQRVIQENTEQEVDMLWVDYLTRLPIDPEYTKLGMTATEAINETIKDAKRFAMSFGKNGLAVCSPFQMNREGFKKAKANEGRVDLTALAQYNAAEKEADSITYIFYDKEETATCEPKCGLLKTRWGEMTFDPVSLYIQPDSRRIEDVNTGMGSPTGSSPTRTRGMPAEEVVI